MATPVNVRAYADMLFDQLDRVRETVTRVLQSGRHLANHLFVVDCSDGGRDGRQQKTLNGPEAERMNADGVGI